MLLSRFTERLWDLSGRQHPLVVVSIVQEDTEEHVNLARDPAHAETVQKMRALLKQRQAEAARAPMR